MSHFRRLCAVLVLACALAGSALAGDIHCGVTLTCAESTPTDSEIKQPTAPNEEAQSIVIETALTLLESALSVF